MMRSIPLGAFLALLFTTFAWATPTQSTPQPTARLSAGIAKFGSSVRLQVELEGSRDARIVEVPKVDGLSFSGPSRPRLEQFHSMSSRGVVSQITVSWILEIRPLEVGEFVIPPIVLDVDGRSASTRELTLKVVQDMRGEDLGFFEIIDRPTKVFEGQPFTLDLRLGWDAELKVELADLRLPWWNNMPGTLRVEQKAGTGRPRTSLGLNGQSQISVEELPEVKRNGRVFRTFRLRESLIPSRSGTLDFPTSSLEFGIVKRRQFPRDIYESYYAILPPFELTVATIPEEDRPFDWTGAVGLIEVGRRVDRRDVDVGESIKLAVSWTGKGNLEFFDAPDPARLDQFAGFRVLGTEDEFLGDERRVTYDLVPTSPEVDEIPPIPLWIFDPDTESFREIETKPIDIRVRALAEGGGLEVEEEPEGGLILDIRDLHPQPVRARALQGPGSGAIWGVFFGAPLLWLFGRTLVRRRGDPGSIESRRRRGARGRLVRELKGSASAREQSEALQRFLAARTGESDQAWLGRDAQRWSEREAGVGVEAPLLAELRGLVERLDHSAWAGDGTPLQSSEIASLAGRLIKGGL